MNRWITDLSQVAFGTAAAVSFSVTAAKSVGPMRLCHSLMAAGMGAWTAGQIMWTWSREVATIDIPFPGPADIGYLVVPFLAIPAVWILMSKSCSRYAVASFWEQLRILIESAIMSFGYLGLILFAIPAFSSSIRQLHGLGLAVGSAYIVTDTISLSMLLLSWRMTGFSLPIIFLSSGFACLLLSDSSFLVTLFTSHNTIAFGSDFGFIAAPALLFLAARSPSMNLNGAGSAPFRRWPRAGRILGATYTIVGAAAYLVAIALGYPGMLGIPLWVYIIMVLALFLLICIDGLLPTSSPQL